MAANQYERHGQGRASLKELFSSPDKVSVIHYSCESFYDLPEGRSPRITSVAVRNLDTAQTVSFSIHQSAELMGRDLSGADIAQNYNELEKGMLDAFYVYLRNNMPSKFLHWNMRDINYGFQAIEYRYRVLGGDPLVVADDRKIDLSRLLIQIYGISYIGHPRLENILKLNNIKAKDFMNGAEEAKAFEDARYVDLHRSTLRKVDVFCNIAQRAYDKSLKTNSGWKERHGLSFKTILYLIKKHWIFSFLLFVGSAGAAIAGIYRGYDAITKYLFG